MRKSILITGLIIALTVISCEGFFLDPEPIGRINPDDPEYTGTIEGRAEIRISGGDTVIESGDNYTLPQSTEAYDTQSFDFKIENLSSDTALSLSGDPLVEISGTDAALFSISLLPESSIAADSSTVFTLDFTPDSAGTKTAVLTIANNDDNESSYMININASAVFNPVGTALADDFASSGATIIADSYLAPRDYSATEITVGGNITVQAGAALTIYPGVTLSMGTNNLLVNGTLYIEGTDGDRVKFIGSGWGGITVAGDANINGAVISDYDPVAGFAVQSTGGDVTMTNCRILQPGDSTGFLVADNNTGGTFNLSNNIFIGLIDNGYGIEVRSSLNAAITMNVVYNTFIGKGDAGFAVSSYDDDSSSQYTFEHNIFANDDDYAANNYLGVLEFQFSNPLVSASYNVYDDRPSFDYHINLDTDTHNLAIAWDNSVIFENIGSNNFRLKQTTTYPSLSQAGNIAELEGSLTNGHGNEVGAYGNGGYPPDYNE